MGFVPAGFELALGMLIISMIGWGSWANTLKRCGNWRFEAWYVFYAIGFFLSTLVFNFTLGMMGQPTFLDVLSVASGSDMAYASASGIIWNIGNIMLVVSIVLAGFAFAFPIGVGIAIVLGTILSYIVNPNGNPFLLFLGITFIIAAIILDSFAYILRDKHLGRKLNGSKIKKGIIFSIITGILIGLFPFFLSLSLTPKGSLDSYAVMLFFTGGALLSTAPFIYLISKFRA
ncbi:AcrB/AcrD/AcrF family protein, partial [archaeon]